MNRLQHVLFNERRLMVSFAVILSIIARPLAAEEDEDNSIDVKSYSAAELLEPLGMLASQVRGNYELIKTWDGSYEFVDKFYFSSDMPRVDSHDAIPADPSSGYWSISRGVVEFQWDVASDQLHVLYAPNKPHEYVHSATGRRVKRSDVGDIYHWILTPEHWIEFGANVELGQREGFPHVASVGSTGGRIATRNIRRQADRFTRVVHPQDFFSNGGMPFWRTCELYSDALRGGRTLEEKKHVKENITLVQRTSKQGTEYVLTNKYPRRGGEEDVKIVQTTFDSSVGFLPTSWVRSTGKVVTDKRTFSYKNVSGVFIPAEFKRVKYKMVKPGLTLPTISRTFTLKQSTLNEEISPKHFSIEQLGLKYGERMLDEIENQLYVMDKSGLVPVEQFTIDPVKAPPAVYLGERTATAGPNWTLIVVNGIVVLGLAVVIVWRKVTAHG